MVKVGNITVPLNQISNFSEKYSSRLNLRCETKLGSYQSYKSRKQYIE